MTLVNLKSYRVSIATIVMILSLVLLFFIAKRGIADVYAYQARAYVEHWQKKTSNLTNSQWQLAFQSLSKALSLVPNHPDYIEAMAGLFQWQLLLAGITQDQAITVLNNSKVFYLKAIQLRPAWPYAWANYALIKQQLNELDQEYNHALQQASSLGLWELKIQMQIAESTFANLNVVDKSIQKLAIDNGFRLLHTDVNTFIQIAKKYKVLATLCAKFPRDDTVKLACSNKQLY